MYVNEYVNIVIIYYAGLVEDIVGLMGANNRVLFQNAKADITMGVWFNDPDIRLEDIFWFNELAQKMDSTKDENLIFVDEKHKAKSCFVELHRLVLMGYCLQCESFFIECQMTRNRQNGGIQIAGFASTSIIISIFHHLTGQHFESGILFISESQSA